MADAQQKGSKRGLWFKLGRFVTGVTIACFFLPFFGISCNGTDVVHMSGADLAGGCKPGGMLVDAQEKPDKSAMQGGEIKVDNVPREPLAIVALALALVVAGLSWVRTRGAMVGACALSVVCIGALIGLWLKVGGNLDEQVEQQAKRDTSGGQMMKDVKIESGPRFGLFISIGGLLGAAVLSGLALAERDRPS